MTSYVSLKQQSNWQHKISQLSQVTQEELDSVDFSTRCICTYKYIEKISNPKSMYPMSFFKKNNNEMLNFAQFDDDTPNKVFVSHEGAIFEIDFEDYMKDHENCKPRQTILICENLPKKKI